MLLFIRETIRAFFDMLIFFWPMLAVLAWLTVSLIMNIRTPEDHPKKKRWRMMVLISGVISGVWVLLLLVLSWLLMLAVRNM